jgi:hypothetical protein
MEEDAAKYKNEVMEQSLWKGITEWIKDKGCLEHINSITPRCGERQGFPNARVWANRCFQSRSEWLRRSTEDEDA